MWTYVAYQRTESTIPVLYHVVLPSDNAATFAVRFTGDPVASTSSQSGIGIALSERADILY